MGLNCNNQGLNGIINNNHEKSAKIFAILIYFNLIDDD